MRKRFVALLGAAAMLAGSCTNVCAGVNIKNIFLNASPHLCTLSDKLTTVIFYIFLELVIFKEFPLSFNHLINTGNVAGNILHILYPLDPFAMVKDQLGRTACPQCDDRLFFLHNQYIVNSGFVNLCIANIFKISLHILLSVQIVRAHSHLICGFHGQIHDLLIVLKGHFLIFFFEISAIRCIFCCNIYPRFSA